MDPTETGYSFSCLRGGGDIIEENELQTNPSYVLVYRSTIDADAPRCHTLLCTLFRETNVALDPSRATGKSHFRHHVRQSAARLGRGGERRDTR